MTDGNPTYPNPDDAGGDPLRRTLRRCPSETYEAALAFRRTRSPACIGPIVAGVLSRCVAPEVRPRLSRPDPTLRLVEDLGLDSLDKIQVVMLLEEVLQLSINDRALAEISTLGDAQRVIADIVAAEPTRALGLMSNRSALA